MKIAIFETSDLERKLIGKYLSDNTITFFDGTIQDTPIEKFCDSEVLCVFVHSKVTENVISKCPNLKLVCTRSTGIDHIDKNALEQRNILLKNVPLYGENTVAEHTFALMLALSRRLRESYTNTLNGNYSTDGLMGFDLKDKTIGIIGGGRIGLHVARMARSFGMHVRVYDINQDSFLAEIINFKYVTLDELLKISDIVSLHVPYNKYTHHIINADTLSKMKNGAILINTARGSLVDTSALIEALNQGKIYGAGLDVLEGEEYMNEESIADMPTANAAKAIEQNTELTKFPNVIITPHNAFNSIEAIERIVLKTVKNINEIK